MIEAYVLGRPMPFSSSSFTSVASVNRRGGVDRLPGSMRGSAGLDRVGLRRQVLGAVARGDVLAQPGQRIIGDARGIATHVRDEAHWPIGPATRQLHAFVQLLRNLHRA